MARKKNASDLETPECDAPDSWADIDAGVWQSQKGRWAAPQHYMCSYMAMFPPELPHYFIERFTEPGDTVLDPFCGRGTAPVEAAAQRRHGIGNDLNPLAVALTRGKLSNPSLDDVLVRLDELEAGYDPSEWGHFSGAPRKIRMIFHINTLRQLMFLKRELDWSTTGTDAFLTAVLMGALHGSSKGFLSLPMPNTFSMGWGYIEGKVKEDPEKWKCPDRDAFEVLRERVKRQLAKGRLTGSGETIYGDVRDLDHKVEHGSVQLLFTSPPYLRVIKYGLYNWIRLWFLTESGSHKEVDEVLDDTHALVEYLDFMRDTLTATLPLMDRERGISCWAIGDVKGLNLAWAVWHHAASGIEIEADDGSVLRYKLIAIVEDNIPAEQKVTKLWKTKRWSINRVDEEGSEVWLEFESEEEAKAAHHIVSVCQDVGAAVQQSYPELIDGREAIEWMRRVGSSHWRKMEWPGHYLEEFGNQTLDREFEKSLPPKYGNTEFDGFVKDVIIDFKNHNLHNPKGKENHTAIMNDANAIRLALKEHPMAFLVVSGDSKFDDDGSFKIWHDSIKGRPSRYVQEGRRIGRASRTRKRDFTVVEMKIILFRNENELDRAIDQGWIRQSVQGQNSNSKPRPDKFHIRLDKIPSDFCIELDSRVEYNLIEHISDKSGKATSLDRILIISPETANPLPLVPNDEVQWEPIFTGRIMTLKSFQ